MSAKKGVMISETAAGWTVLFTGDIMAPGEITQIKRSLDVQYRRHLTNYRINESLKKEKTDAGANP